MPTFFDLPPEIRQMIYNCCLVVGEVFPYTVSETYDEYDDDFDDDPTNQELSGCEHPCVALFSVCRKVRLEAEPILYQRNTIVLPASDLTARFFKRCLHNDSRRAWVRSVDISLDASDMTRSDREVVLDEELALVREDMLFPDKAPFGWPKATLSSEDMHDAYQVRLGEVVWPRKTSYLLDLLHLEHLAVDLRESRCLDGCCCMVPQGIESMSKGFALALPRTIIIRGAREHTQFARGKVNRWTSKRLGAAEGNTTSDRKMEPEQ
ncbi:MAG: hypothetical protein Q9175_003963 [Cornicularia normoerica]